MGQGTARANPRDIEICQTIGPVLKERGLLFVGIDVVVTIRPKST